MSLDEISELFARLPRNPPSRPQSVQIPPRSGKVLGRSRKLGKEILAMPTRVWRRFEAARGSLKLRVEELAADRYDEAVAMLLKHFTADEPPCKHIEVHKHPAALAALERLWRGALAQGVSVACVVDDDAEAPELVGVNVLAVAGREDKDEVFQSDDPVWAALYGAVDLVSRSVDICQHFAVERYLTAFGLVVAPQYRGMAVGKEILLAR
ncbi:unnamed protein product [Plutella xylostella]|uniref:(diamondback moth) hypothetical protein n=1 Tax=Plutella xylostella TaxID=51655 RepID=A0A8S4G3B2_PLUXY|nr:unnamed protein product [Plutella xylostella]